MEHTKISKDEAYKLMEQGLRISHEYYSEDEYLIMRNGMIFDEEGHFMGTKDDDFWSNRQKWETGWIAYSI